MTSLEEMILILKVGANTFNYSLLTINSPQ